MTDENNKPTHDDTKPQAGQEEPSMEDILTSIRRILSEEGSDGGEDVESQEGAETMERERNSDSRSEMGIELTETLSDPSPQEETQFNATPVEPPPGEADGDNVLMLTPEMRVPSKGPVMSSITADASADALSQLARAILDHRDMNVGSRDVTLEAMVRSMLRPLLKEWLDRNLPYLIERLVKKEIDLMVNRAERLED